MNFFTAQDSARRRTGILAGLFLLAIFSLLGLTNFLFYEFLFASRTGAPAVSITDFRQVFDPSISIMISAAILLFIVLGSAYKLVQLSAGGKAIAESLGGIHIPRSSQDPLQRRILNIVEEMAIASGTPVPQVYVLNETGINAFAAGWKTTSVVIGITQGALETLSREELQGVIAHEFSHIFNGDMRLNLRLVAVLHGILLLGLLGGMIVRSLRYSGRSRNSKNAQALLAVFAAGSALLIIGYSGSFFGGWIKALISRQREFLADASAVQFTRSPDGIANALKKIGGSVQGSTMLAASADEYSHAFFARGNTNISLLNFSTHPPLKQRILRLQPDWSGRFIFPEKKSEHSDSDVNAEKSRSSKEKIVMETAAAVTAAGSVDAAVNAINSIGEIGKQQVETATAIQQALPDYIRQQAENPYGAQLLILVILLDKNTQIRAKQYSLIEKKYGLSHRNNAEKLYTEVIELAHNQILPLIDLSMPTLREMTPQQYAIFRKAVQAFILADNKIDIKEWVIQRLVLQHLDDSYHLRRKPIAKYFVLGSAKPACEMALSLLAHIEHSSTEKALVAFNAGKKAIGAGALTMLEKSDISLKKLDRAMDDLVLLKYPLKQRFLKAAAACIAEDNKVTVRGYELLRAFASCMDCPMPPGLPV